MRKHLISAALGGLVAAALAGGVAWAAIGDGGVIQGCYDGGGNLKVVGALPCPKGYTQLTWNQQGPKGETGPAGATGTPGASPTVAQLAVGGAHCPAGGAAITDAAGSTAYVCAGANGADGQSFAGTFMSPNGEYSISVTDTGVSLKHGPSTSIRVVGNTLELRSAESTTLKAGTTATVEAGTNFTLTGEGTGLVQSLDQLSLKGSTINLN